MLLITLRSAPPCSPVHPTAHLSFSCIRIPNHRSSQGSDWLPHPAAQRGVRAKRRQQRERRRGNREHHRETAAPQTGSGVIDQSFTRLAKLCTAGSSQWCTGRPCISSQGPYPHLHRERCGRNRGAPSCRPGEWRRPQSGRTTREVSLLASPSAILTAKRRGIHSQLAVTRCPTTT